MLRTRWHGRYLMLLGMMLATLALAACGVNAQQPAQQTQHTLARDGGVRFMLRASCLPDAPACDLTKQRDAAITALSRRITGNTSVHDAVVRADSAANIVVELPGISDNTQITSITTLLTDAGGKIEMLDSGDALLDVGASVAGKTCASACDAGQYRIVFTGNQIDASRVRAQQDDQHSGTWMVEFAFAGAAKKQFADYTASHIGQPLVITLNDVVIAAPTILTEIAGAGQFSGLSEAKAQQVTHDLKVGALPATITVVTTERVAPSSA